MKKKEFQVKFKLENVEEFLNILQENKFVLLGGSFENTYRYDYKDNRLKNKGIFIRTKEGFNNIITIKEFPSQQRQKKFFERDTVSFEIESCDKMSYILKKIGLCNVFQMQKYRLLWQKGQFEISVDELPFGVYCDISSSENNIKKYLKIFGNQKFFNTTYWEIFNQIYPKSKQKNIIFKKDHIFQLTSII